MRTSNFFARLLAGCASAVAMAPALAASSSPTPSLHEEAPAEEASTLLRDAGVPSGERYRLALVGFVELTALFHQHFVGQDVSTAFWTIPFANDPVGRAPEFRLSARQSRLGARFEMTASPAWTLGAVAEVDFLGAARTATMVESNGFTPRVRLMALSSQYQATSVRWAFTAGQLWSLATAHSRGGFELGTEALLPGIEGQFSPGFVWARQPQLRLSAFVPAAGLSAAVSIENPQTTFLAPVPSDAVVNAPMSYMFDPATNGSLGSVPDLIGKIGFDASNDALRMHAETFAMARYFVAVQQGSTRGVWAGGGGGSVVVQSPRAYNASLQVAAMGGQGVGRYAAGQFPDAQANADGSLRPLPLTALMATFAVEPMAGLSAYAYAGTEWSRSAGQPADNRGCSELGGACSGATAALLHASGGAWYDIKQFERAALRVGGQYSFTQRRLQKAAGGAPGAQQHQAFISVRLATM